MRFAHSRDFYLGELNLAFQREALASKLIFDGNTRGGKAAKVGRNVGVGVSICLSVGVRKAAELFH